MSSTTVTTAAPRASRSRDAVARVVAPAVRLLNRPAFRRVAELTYDVALRLNGFAIGFPGQHGLSHAEEAFLARHLPAAAPGALLDVGANGGSYARSLRRLRPDLPVVAFEPHPRTYTALVANVAGQGIETVNMALSDRAGPMRLFDFADQDGSTQASLSHDAVTLYDGATVAHDVTCVTLDDWAAARGMDRIALLKIDTEGFDVSVLRGAKALLAAGRIDAIQFEFIPANIATRVTMRDFFDVLGGYRLHRLCADGGLWPLSAYDVKRCEVYVTHNVIALRNAG